MIIDWLINMARSSPYDASLVFDATDPKIIVEQLTFVSDRIANKKLLELLNYFPSQVLLLTVLNVYYELKIKVRINDFLYRNSIFRKKVNKKINPNLNIFRGELSGASLFSLALTTDLDLAKIILNNVLKSRGAINLDAKTFPSENSPIKWADREKTATPTVLELICDGQYRHEKDKESFIELINRNLKSERQKQWEHLYIAVKGNDEKSIIEWLDTTDISSNNELLRMLLDTAVYFDKLDIIVAVMKHQKLVSNKVMRIDLLKAIFIFSVDEKKALFIELLRKIPDLIIDEEDFENLFMLSVRNDCKAIVQHLLESFPSESIDRKNLISKSLFLAIKNRKKYTAEYLAQLNDARSDIKYGRESVSALQLAVIRKDIKIIAIFSNNPNLTENQVEKIKWYYRITEMPFSYRAKEKVGLQFVDRYLLCNESLDMLLRVVNDEKSKFYIDRTLILIILNVAVKNSMPDISKQLLLLQTCLDSVIDDYQNWLSIACQNLSRNSKAIDVVLQLIDIYQLYNKPIKIAIRDSKNDIRRRPLPVDIVNFLDLPIFIQERLLSKANIIIEDVPGTLVIYEDPPEYIMARAFIDMGLPKSLQGGYIPRYFSMEGFLEKIFRDVLVVGNRITLTDHEKKALRYAPNEYKIALLKLAASFASEQLFRQLYEIFRIANKGITLTLLMHAINMHRPTIVKAIGDGLSEFNGVSSIIPNYDELLSYITDRDSSVVAFSIDTYKQLMMPEVDEKPDGGLIHYPYNRQSHQDNNIRLRELVCSIAACNMPMYDTAAYHGFELLLNLYLRGKMTFTFAKTHFTNMYLTDYNKDLQKIKKTSSMIIKQIVHELHFQFFIKFRSLSYSDNIIDIRDKHFLRRVANFYSYVMSKLFVESLFLNGIKFKEVVALYADVFYELDNYTEELPSEIRGLFKIIVKKINYNFSNSMKKFLLEEFNDLPDDLEVLILSFLFGQSVMIGKPDLPEIEEIKPEYEVKEAAILVSGPDDDEVAVSEEIYAMVNQVEENFESESLSEAMPS